MADDEDRRIIVVKVGTSSIMRDGSGNLALSTLASLVEMLCGLRDAGHRVILVSSGVRARARAAQRRMRAEDPT